jgi:hypothetical protein
MPAEDAMPPEDDMPGNAMPAKGAVPAPDAAMAGAELALDLVPPAAARRGALVVGAGALIVAAAVGGVLGLLAGRTAGLIGAAVIGIPLLLLALSDLRKRVGLTGSTVRVRRILSRSADIRRAEKVELVVTDVRNKRTVSVFVAGPPSNRAVPVSLASYSATGGVELGILELRRLADAFVGAEHSSGLVVSELLVAQLRAEARGEGLQGRPLYQLASAVSQGKLARRVHPQALVKFVGDLD